MKDNVKTRLMQFIKHYGMTTKSFENRCGMSNGYINSMRRGLGEEKLNNVLTTFPELNREWLLFGEGEMLKNESRIVVMRPSGNIRYWEDVSATGGSPEFLMNPNEHDVRMIDVPNFGDCTDAVNIYGDSMSPLLYLI